MLLATLLQKIIWISLGGVGAIALIWFGLRWLEQTSLYYPDRIITTIPTDFSLPFEDLTLTTTDKKKINAWYISARSLGIPFTRPFTVLLSHGNAGNIGDRIEKVKILSGLGLNVLLYDYRGYGKSAGTPTETGTYADGAAAYAYLTQTRRAAAEDIFFYGESLGTAIATELAVQFKGAGLILESPFTSIVEMTKILFPWLPADLVVKYRYDTLMKIPRVKIPVLIMHSPLDQTIPYAMGRAVFAAANNPKEFLELRGGHNDGFSLTENYVETLRTFVSGRL